MVYRRRCFFPGARVPFVNIPCHESKPVSACSGRQRVGQYFDSIRAAWDQFKITFLHARAICGHKISRPRPDSRPNAQHYTCSFKRSKRASFGAGAQWM